MSALKKNKPANTEVRKLTPEELDSAVLYNAEKPELATDILIDDGTLAYQAAMNEIDRMVNISEKAREDYKRQAPRSSFLNTYARLNAKPRSNPILKEYLELKAFFDWKILSFHQNPVPEALKRLARLEPEEVAKRLLLAEGEERGIYLEGLKRRQHLFKKVDQSWIRVIEQAMADLGGSLMTPELINIRFKKDEQQ